jgi:hypothetical protein
VSARSAAAAVLATAAVGATIVAPAASSSCAEAVEWQGIRYEGMGGTLRAPVAFGERLGEGAIPSCSDEDGIGCRGPESSPVDVLRLPGIDPAIAVGVPPRGRLSRVYLAPGYFPELPGHPLHDAVYERGRPNERLGSRCEAPVELAGTVVRTPTWGGVFAVRFAGDLVRRQFGYTAVFVDAQTRIVGLDRNGLPYVDAGDRLQARVRECTASGERYKVVADLIEPGGGATS